ncbi:beta strand repeat-containing protein, partial [Methylophaga thiooxydans]|uniref:beta strand repeat-containing protein n=1 Tax=Methylophaga thiooxydans TaxID=392484 RepID=UPI002357947C
IDGVGDYSFNANGNWTFEPADSVNNTEGDVDASFSYRIEDADGDNAEAMQPISIADGQDPLAGEPITLSLDDQNLADGSTPAVDDFDTGSIVFTPGSDPIASIVFSMDLSGLDPSLTWERVSDNQIIGRDGVDDIVTLDLGVIGDTATITATLNNNYDSHPTINVDDLKALGSVGVVATDSDGDFATGIVNVEVSDDLPTANDDGPETVTEDATGFVSGNVLDNDDANADQAAAFVGWSGADAATIATLNSFGTLVQNGDGSWSYTLDNSLATTQALTAADTMDYVLNYTMADADGDEDTATLTITIKGADDDATVETAQAEGPDATVYEAGLNPDGSDAASDSETVTGSFDVSASDGILTVVIGTTTFTLAEVQAFDGSDSVTTGEGTLTLTGYTGDAMSGTIAYSYTLDGTIDNDSIVPSGDDAVTPAHFDDSVEISVNGLGGTTASDDLVIRAVDDVPAAEDYIGGSYAEGSSNNVVAADAASTLGIAGGADGLNSTLQAISFTGGQGSLFINGSGQLIYTPPANVVNPGGAPVSDVFSYTVTDNDGDFVTKQVTVGITDTGVTELSASNALVDEDDLPMGNDDSATGDDNPITSGTISYTVGADGFDSVSLSTTGDTTGLMTHDGDAVDTLWDSGSNTLIGYVAGTDSSDAANQVFTVTLTNINASGADYDMTLLQPVKHPDADNENNVDFTVNVSVLDNDSSEGITSFNVSIDDDLPVATPEENSGEATLEVDTNLMLSLDVSGSMNDSANFQGMTRLEVMIKSSLELLDQYDAYGDVLVNIVTFASNGSDVSGGWVTVAEAKAIILGLSAGGSTNYVDALNDLINSYNANTGDMIVDGQRVAYFMSDGNPNTGGTVNEGNWETFVTNNGINAFALGMGTGVTSSNLEPISYNGVDDVEQAAIVVDDFADLQATLIGTIDVPPLSGNLIDGGAGADEGWVYSVTVGGVTYIYDQPSDAQSVSGGASNGSFDAASNVWTITTPEGGTLTVDMVTGDYQYLGSDMVPSVVQEAFAFTISDYDGDMDSSTLTVTIDPAAGPMIVRDDFVLTNQDPADIPDWALLANDSGPDSDSQVISAVVSDTGGDATDNGNDTITFDDTDSAGGSFVYTNTAGARSDDGNVSVERQSGDTIQGDYLDEILIGGSGAETLNGGAGNDILIGGNGATGTAFVSRQVNLDVRSGQTFNNSNQFGFAFVSGAGLYITEIRIDISSEGFFDQEGSGSNAFTVGNQSTVLLADINTVSSGDVTELVITFDPNTFVAGDTLRFGIDTDGSDIDEGGDFGDESIPYSISFSDGETINGNYTDGPGSGSNDTSDATALGTAVLEPVIDDTLNGGAGDDILQGGGGSDLLSGGSGDDIFMWRAGDDGTVGSPAMDFVTDFNDNGDDVLDISDLLVGEESGDLTDYLSVMESGSDVVIEVTPSGAGAHTQVITLQNTSLSDLGANPADSQADIISSLISQGHIHVDQS